MSDRLRQRIKADRPKRILSLDGGGIRGLIALGYLERVESLLRDNFDALDLYERPASAADFRLRDYYDLIGGTSTGAIIAAGLSIGMTVREILDAYNAMSKTIFGRASFLGGATKGGLAAKFGSKQVRKVLDRILGDRILGDPSLTTGLCIVAKRYDTNSVWVMTNAPDNLFYDDPQSPNSAFSLAQLVRASTAAPSYFDPETIKIGNRSLGFIDGGVSMHNNPALQLFMAATLPNFGYSWPVGVDKLSLLSIGTGEWSRKIPLSKWSGRAIPATMLTGVIDMFMEDSSALNETILQAIGRGSNRREIDMLTGSLTGMEWGAPLLRYERLQTVLEDRYFHDNGLSAYVGKLAKYRQMDSLKYMKDLVDIGRLLGEKFITFETLT